MEDILNLSKQIAFEPVSHVYTNLKGERLISVSQLVHLFAPTFDEDGKIAKRCAEKEGISVEEIKAKWKKAGEDSCVLGTNIHAAVEHYILTKKILKNEHSHWVKKFKKIKFEGKLYSEVKLFDEENYLAGTTDLIEFFKEDNSFIIWDFKTNKKLESYSFGNKMLPPFSYLNSANLIHYAFQLNIYASIIEKFGYWCRGLNLLHFCPKKEDIINYEISFMLNETKLMIDTYKNNRQKFLNKIECKE